MTPFTEAEIRASFINSTRSERARLTLPAAFDSLDWANLDYLGWRDPRLPKVSHLVTDLDGQATGVHLTRGDARPRARAQCSWCSDITLPNDVVLYSARRAGPAGRRGDTVGILICENFECSRNVRKLPPSTYLGFDREAARDLRILSLQTRVDAFARDLRDHPAPGR